MDTPDVLIAGICGRAVGLRGEVEIQVLSDDPSRFAVGASLLLEPGRTPVTIRSARRHKERFIVAFAGMDDRTAAESLRGRALAVPGDAARSLDADEFWDHELIGCEVRTTDGAPVGVVQDVLHGPGGDMLQLERAIVPLVKSICVEVDPASRTITIDPPEGLI